MEKGGECFDRIPHMERVGRSGHHGVENDKHCEDQVQQQFHVVQI